MERAELLYLIMSACREFRVSVRCFERLFGVERNDNDEPTRITLMRFYDHPGISWFSMKLAIARRLQVEVYSLWNIIAQTADGRRFDVNSNEAVSRVTEYHQLLVFYDTTLPIPVIDLTGKTMFLKQMHSLVYDSERMIYLKQRFKTRE